MSDTPRDLGPEGKRAFKTAARTASRRPSDRQIVREMLPEIRLKRKAGWSYAEIRAALAETQGFAGTLASLYSYVSKLSNPQKSPPVATPVATPPRPRRVSDLCGHFAHRDPEANQPRKKRKRSLVEILNKPL